MYSPTNNPYQFKYLVTGITGEGIKEVFLPEPPRDKDVYFKKEDRWVRPEPPKHIKKAIKVLYAKMNRYSRTYDKNYVSPYAYEIKKWEDQQWDRFENGFWFWNKGVKTYITGFYYWYLTEWNPYFGTPQYRETDKEITYWLQFIEEDPNSYGGMLNTIRRYGKSALMGGWLMFRTTRNFAHYSGMQGESDDKIEKFWQTHIIKPFRKLNGYVTPVYDTTSKQTADIKFERPISRGKEGRIDVDIDDEDFIDSDAESTEDLESYIDWRDSTEGAYDQAVLMTYLMEEPGKCHARGTLVRMYDGTLKKVEDVNIGDLLMGDDSKPRRVRQLGRGFSKIYKIIPNKKGEPWYCNEAHILSCKVSDDRRFPGYKKGDVLNISVKDYLKLNEDRKRHLVAYRVGVEYKEVKHEIDPYLLGVWLGDGSSAAPEITNTDEEVVNWITNSFVKSEVIEEGKTTRYYIKNGLRTLLRSKNLLKNKHIPNDYLIDCRANRLSLLAGLIDTDGHRECRADRPNQRSYEITQKNKELAYQIKELCFSLGFYASLKEKTARMKRKDGTVYRCQVYRISIYGRNLHDIPCKVKRKRMPDGITTYNSKDPSVYGFKVEYDRDDYYYGFNISGNHLYLLADYTVTHNTKKANVNDRWTTVKPCLRRGKFIRGKALLATTVEHMNVLDRGGKAYQKIFYESDYDKRNALNQTVSGLYAAFLPGDCAYEGFYDDYGHPMREEARRSILIERESKKHNPKDHAAVIRQYPLKINEIFWVSSEGCVFNATILQKRKQYLDTLTRPLYDKYELRWKDNKPFTEVIFSHNENGWYKSTWMFPGADKEKYANKVRKNADGSFSPLNEDVFTGGLDPVDHRVVIENISGSGENEYTTTRRSKPVFLVKRRYDPNIDVMPDGSAGILTQELLEYRRDTEFPYKTGVYIGMIDDRHSDPNVNYERVLMVCWLHGMSAMIESSKPGQINYLMEKKCGDFSKQKYVPEALNKQGYQGEGTPASSMMINEYTDAVATNVEYFGHTDPFPEVVDDQIQFKPHKTKEHDYTVSKGWTELGERVRPKTVKMPTIDITDIMPTFRNGDMVRRR